MSPVPVLVLLLSPLLLSLLIVGVIACIAIIRVAPADVPGVLGLLVKLLASLSEHYPQVGATWPRRLAPPPYSEEGDAASDASANTTYGDTDADGGGGQDEEAVG